MKPDSILHTTAIPVKLYSTLLRALWDIFKVMYTESFYHCSGIGIVAALATTLFSPYINIHNLFFKFYRWDVS